MRRKNDESVLSTSMWADIAPVSGYAICYAWLDSMDWISGYGWLSLGSIVLVLPLLNYFLPSVSLHDAFIRVGDKRLFKRDIVDVERGRFVVKLRDLSGEKVCLRRWILTCKAEGELDEWLKGVREKVPSEYNGRDGR